METGKPRTPPNRQKGNAPTMNSRKGNLTEGPLTPQIIRFILPLMATGVLQLLYNAADMVVVGRFCSYEALGAVGSTSPVNQLIVNFFVCISVGSNVIAANYYGAKNFSGLTQFCLVIAGVVIIP